MSVTGRVFQAARGREAEGAGRSREQGANTRPEQKRPELGEPYCVPALARYWG